MSAEVAHMLAALRWKKTTFAERFGLAPQTVYNWGDNKWPAWAVRALRLEWDNARLTAALAAAVAEINHPHPPSDTDPAQNDMFRPAAPAQEKMPWDL